MIEARFNHTWPGWRETARELLRAEIAPASVLWGGEEQPGLFAPAPPTPSNERPPVRVPKAFLRFGALVACHREERRWAVMYRVLWRLTHDEPWLLEIQTDPDVREFLDLWKQVTRDIHQMQAFVRFREHKGRYIAWYQPDHRIVEEVGPWFARRFPNMDWSILTPDRCAHWDRRALSFTDGVPRSAAPEGDHMEDLWRAYYASTFNPARVNVQLLRQHMPERRWETLPEAELIHQLARESVGRTQTMLAGGTRPVSAASFLPGPRASLPGLASAIHACRGCDLWQDATQPVFGEGPEDARIVLVGEQPGDNEDLQGRPFVGPAGRLLDQALADAGLDREQLYLTAAVKHFRYEQRGKARIHKTASKAQVAACQPWLEAQLSRIRPRVIVAMGNTAALSVIGRGVRLMEERGSLLPHRFASAGVLITVHPGFILRMPDPVRREQEYARWIADFRFAKEAA